MTREEMDTLQYEVSLNGVNEEFRHVLDSEVAKYGELEPAQMYNAVKCHEVYLSRNKHLLNKGSYSNQVKAPQPDSTNHLQATNTIKLLPSQRQPLNNQRWTRSQQVVR